MKKTININLAGYPFIIDEDAYKLLKDYLDTIRYAFDSEDDTEDIASDIESRVAEILSQKKQKGVRIISCIEISEIIDRIGNPSDFMENSNASIKEDISINDTKEEKNDAESERVKIEETISPPPYTTENTIKNTNLRKRLYRDPQNSMLGGVCAGLAAYCHIDPSILRLITVLLFFLSATTVAIVYIVLWIVLPAANTPLQQMQMRGEDPTMENIGKTVTENFREQNETSAHYNEPESKGFLSGCLSVFIKCLVIIGLIIGIPLLFAFGIGLFGCIVAVFVLAVIVCAGVSSGPFWMFSNNSEEIMVIYILLAVIGGIITLGIPLWLFIRNAWKKNDRENNNMRSRRSLLVIWMVGIALLSVFAVKAVKKANQIDRWDLHFENIMEENEINNENLKSIELSKEGISIQTEDGNKISVIPIPSDTTKIEIETIDSIATSN